VSWPWVARSTLDAVCAERDRLLADNQKLLEHVTRVQRHESGLPEVPRQPRERRASPMPTDLSGYIAGIQNPALRRTMRAEAWRRYKDGETWEAIQAEVMRPPEEEE
jgi:hypothetical protein